MKKIHRHIEAAGESVTLSGSERARMRAVLHAYMAMKPLRREAEVARSAPWNMFTVFAGRRSLAALVAAGVFALSGGVSYAAENTVPGDLLYAIKTNINEPLAGAVAFSSEAKADWNMRVAGKRVSEASTLAAEGRLSPETETKLQEAFDTHVEAAAAQVEKIATEHPESGAETALRFEAQLVAYADVIPESAPEQEAMTLETAADTRAAFAVMVAPPEGEEKKTSRPLVASIQSARERLGATREAAEQRIADEKDEVKTRTFAKRLRESADRQLRSSSELAESIETGSSSTVAVSEEIRSASGTFQEGTALFESGDIETAVRAFQESLAATEKLGAYLRTSLDVKKRTGVAIPLFKSQKESDKDSSGRGSGRSRATAPADTARMTGHAEGETTISITSAEESDDEAASTTSSAMPTESTSTPRVDLASSTESRSSEGTQSRSSSSGSGSAVGGGSSSAIPSVTDILPLSL